MTILNNGEHDKSSFKNIYQSRVVVILGVLTKYNNSRSTELRYRLIVMYLMLDGKRKQNPRVMVAIFCNL